MVQFDVPGVTTDMKGVIALVSTIMLMAAACGDPEPFASPATPLPAASVPTSAPAPAVSSVLPATPLPPAPAATALPAVSAATSAQASGPSPAPTATPPPPPTPSPTPTPVLFPFTVVGSDGMEVTFEKPPERIVAFDSAVVEILFAIGEGGRVVGTHSFVSYPPQVADVPRVGDAFNMNIEATVALEPDLVFVFSPTFLEQLENAGVRVLYLQSLSDDFIKTTDNIRMWGRIVGNPSAAEAVAADFEARVQRIEEILAPYASGPSVFQDEGGLWTPGPDTLVGEVFELLKLQNIAHDVSGYAQLSPEVIVERNPQIVIASYGDTISGNPAFKDLLAVRSGRIFVPQSDALSVAGPRFIEGIENLAKWVYQGLFD